MTEQSHERSTRAGRQIRSYRQVFRFDTRLYKFDRWSIPVRGGLEVRLLVYVVIVYLLLLFARSIPPVRELHGMMPAPFAWMVLPMGAAFLLSKFRPDGRVPHHAALSMARWACSARKLAGLRPEARVGRQALSGGRVTVLDDWRSGSRIPDGKVAGPATVIVRRHASLMPGRKGGASLEIDPSAPPVARGKRIAVPPGQVLTIRESSEELRR